MYDDYDPPLQGWEIELIASAAQSTLIYNSTRFVKRAPLGMMLTSGDGFRMVK